MVGSYLRLTWETIKLAIAAAMEYRGSFLVQVVGMILHDMAWIAVWAIFFTRFEHIRGWTFEDSAVLFSIGALAYGMVWFCNGLMRISHYIAEGELDSYLTLPKSTLWYTAFSRVDTTTIGDVLAAFLIFFLWGDPTPEKFVLFILMSTLAALITVNFIVMYHCLGFWIANFFEGADGLTYNMISFQTYPQTVFSGMLKLLMVTVIPGFFIAALPVEVVQRFDWGAAGIMFAFWLVTMVLAGVMWRAGLKRYESGNLMTVKL